MTEKIKEGWKTTEFWGAVATGVLGVAMTLGFIGAEEVEQGVTMITELAGAFITAAGVLGYTISRGLAKRPPKSE